MLKQSYFRLVGYSRFRVAFAH
uniref:Uncharacterized protein n=1 Tax=Rhizophora mucronata TaxID=61149 RepID=A0A2P2PPX3_RHIMU